MNPEMNSKKRERFSYFLIIVFPNVLFFIVLGILMGLFLLYDLPWIIFPGQDVLYPLRLIELILGTLMIIIGLHIFSWGLTTISTERASGVEIGKSLEASTLIKYGAFSFCRHPITLGFLFIMPGVGFVFDFIPMLLMTPIYSSMLIGLLFYEEKELLRRYGDKYKNYKEEVPFLIPRIRRSEK